MMTACRPRVLICTDWFVPGFKAGGPIRALDSLVHGLDDRFDFDVVTSDRDLGDSTGYPGIKADVWLDRGRGLRVMYLSPASLSRQRIRKLVRQTPWDCLYLNSMYSVPFTLYPLLAARALGKRIVLAPRGMLHAGALKLKPLKKRLFLAAFRLAGFHRAVMFQATNSGEEEDIRRYFGASAVTAMVPDVPATLATPAADLEKLPGVLRIACVARVARNKNLRFLLERLATVPGDVTLAFYGPIEDQAYWLDCVHAAERLPANIRFEPAGPVSPDEITAALSRAHVFCLPTEGENFGHAIWEAFAAERPVVISDRTPWRNLSATGAGWDLPLERPDEWVATLTRLVTMDGAEWRAHAAAARSFAERFARDADVVRLTAELFAPSSGH